jgi:hypothetical protein
MKHAVTFRKRSRGGHASPQARANHVGAHRVLEDVVRFSERLRASRVRDRAPRHLLPLLVLCLASLPATTETDPVTSRATETIQPVAQKSPRSQSGSESRRAQEPQVEINPTGYTSARVCGTCHVDIYNSWKNSLHAFSLSDPIFDAAYMQAIKEQGAEAKRVCLRCHAPMTLANADYDLELGVTREGVSCDFCHTCETQRVTKGGFAEARRRLFRVARKRRILWWLPQFRQLAWRASHVHVRRVATRTIPGRGHSMSELPHGLEHRKSRE